MAPPLPRVEGPVTEPASGPLRPGLRYDRRVVDVKERVPAIEGWFTTGEAPALLGSRCTACGSYFFPREEMLCRNPACTGRELEDGRAEPAGPDLVVHRQSLPAAAPVCRRRPLRAVRDRGRRTGRRAHGRPRPARPGHRRDDPPRRRRGRARPRHACTRTTITSTWCGSGNRSEGAAHEHRGRRPRRGDAPVGQVGPQLRGVRRGGRRGGVGRRRRRLGRYRLRQRRRHHPQRLPRIHRRRHLRAGPRVPGQPDLKLLRRLRQRGPRHPPGPVPDPRRVQRGGPRGGRRHHAEGVLRPGRRGAPRRPGLAEVPSARRDQSHLLRPVRPAPDGGLRRHPRRLRTGQGQEQPARVVEPVRPLPQGGHRGGGPVLPDRGRPAAPFGGVRHQRRRRGDGALLGGVRPPAGQSTR